jgi:hypothetical protein
MYFLNDVAHGGSLANREFTRAVGMYLGVIAGGNLIWETLQLPLYTIWTTGIAREQAFAVLHCTVGDILIAMSCLVLSLLLVGRGAWPNGRFGHVALMAVAFGVGYTIFSEWLNVSVRRSWAYSEWMPVIALGPLQIGASPIAQWIIVPLAAFSVVRRMRSVQL